MIIIIVSHRPSTKAQWLALNIRHTVILVHVRTYLRRRLTDWRGTCHITRATRQRTSRDQTRDNPTFKLNPIVSDRLTVDIMICAELILERSVVA
jgi:hypothetical protein